MQWGVAKRGASAGVVAALLFFAVHHVVITPIWWAALVGAPFAALVGWALAVVRERAGVRGILLAPPLLVVLLGFALAGLALRAEASALVGATLVLLGLAGGYAFALRLVAPRDRPANAHEAATAALVLVAAAPSLAHLALFTIVSLAEGSDVAVTLTMTATAGVGYVLAGGLLAWGAFD